MLAKNRVVVMTGLLAGLAGIAAPAEARRVAIDNGINAVRGGCTLLSGNAYVPELCAPIPLGFTIKIDDLDYTHVTIYDEGLVSFGTDFSSEVLFAGAEAVSDFGTPVVLANFERQFSSGGGQFVSTGPSGPGGFEAYWYDSSFIWTWNDVDEDGNGCCGGTLAEFPKPPHARLLIEPGQNGGAGFTLTWTRGATDFGYALGVNNPLIRERGGAGERRHQFTLGEFAVVPEPATWAMLIAGFGLVGASLRRQRASTV